MRLVIIHLLSSDQVLLSVSDALLKLVLLKPLSHTFTLPLDAFRRRSTSRSYGTDQSKLLSALQRFTPNGGKELHYPQTLMVTHYVKLENFNMEECVVVEKSPLFKVAYSENLPIHSPLGAATVSEELPSILSSRPQTGLSFLAPEPEDLEDLYTRYKKLQQELEFLEVQEEYIKDEQKNLKKEFLHAQEEVKRIQSIPLVIGQFLEAVDQNTAIVGSTTGSNYYVRILSTIDRELLKPNASVALHKHSNALVDVLPPEADSSIMMLTSGTLRTGPDRTGLDRARLDLRLYQKPDVMYADIGGMDIQKQEVREAVELPLTHFELYKQIGIDPPRGVLMYGPPGCGKTMLAKAVAHHTTGRAATAALPPEAGRLPAFIRVVGSEFVQKYLGEGPRMVRDVFRLAKENAPAIIFIDEIDAIATKRFDAQTGADREVQRILLELLNQMDGFDQNVNVKVIMATNRADTLDPALLRPGRLDRKIEFPLPDRRQKRLIFSTITSKMNLSEEVDLEDYVARPDKISGADINSICQEAGMLAVRENRYIVLAKDFEKAYKTVIKKDEQEHEFYK
ncbi:hypothetical protein CCH79_00018565 [Gambusia affinis]|nr:hypothetical protein CCH79_00018565 [Gambusia affinis]